MGGWVDSPRLTLPRWVGLTLPRQAIPHSNGEGTVPPAVVGRHVYTYGVLSYNSVGSGDCFESPTFDPLDKPLYWAQATLAPPLRFMVVRGKLSISFSQTSFRNVRDGLSCDE